MLWNTPFLMGKIQSLSSTRSRCRGGYMSLIYSRCDGFRIWIFHFSYFIVSITPAIQTYRCVRCFFPFLRRPSLCRHSSCSPIALEISVRIRRFWVRRVHIIIPSSIYSNYGSLSQDPDSQDTQTGSTRNLPGYTLDTSCVVALHNYSTRFRPLATVFRKYPEEQERGSQSHGIYYHQSALSQLTLEE